MSRIRARLVAIAVGAGFLLAGPVAARAQVFTNGCINPTYCTLAELFAGGSIQVDDKRIKNWGIEKLDHSFGAAPDFNLITVEGISALGDPNPLDPGPGIRFHGNGELAVSGVQYLDLRLDFRVASTNPNYQIKDASAQIQSYSGNGDAFFRVNEYLARWDGSVGKGQMFVLADFGFWDGAPPLFDHIEFPPDDELYVEKNFYLEGTEPDSSAQINELDQRYSQQLPEPGELLMLGCGIALLSRLPRRARTAQPIRRQEERS
jgi:hypothetical protein